MAWIRILTGERAGQADLFNWNFTTVHELAARMDLKPGTWFEIEHSAYDRLPVERYIVTDEDVVRVHGFRCGANSCNDPACMAHNKPSWYP